MHNIRLSLLEEIAAVLNTVPLQIDSSISFVRNGGDSLSAIAIASSCRDKQLLVTVGMLMGLDSIDCIIHKLEKTTTSLGSRNETYTNPHSSEQTGSKDIGHILPPRTNHCNGLVWEATDMQLSLIHGGKARLGRNVVRYCETYQTQDIPEVKRAWRALITTEPIFRTIFEDYEDTYLIKEADHVPFTWEETIVMDSKAYETSPTIHNLDTDFMGVAFQAVHLQMGDEIAESKVIWNIHHALMDGYSAVLVLNKHRAILSGGAPSPSPSFVFFLEKVAAFRQTQNATSNSFWDTQGNSLRAAKGELLLPSPRTPVTPVYAREDVIMDISAPELAQKARTAGVTLATIFYTAWALTLSRYVDSNHVFFGVVLSGRTIPIACVGEVIGPLINLVPFDISLPSCLESTGLLKSVFKQSVDLDTFQWNVPRCYAKQKFPSTLDIHFETPILRDSPLGMLQEPETSIVSELPLRVDIHLGGSVRLYYHEHQFYRNDIRQLGKTFARAVSAITNPRLTVALCHEQLVAYESQSLLSLGNFFSTSTATVSGNNETLVDLFHLAAQANLEAIAVEQGTEILTYSNLLSLVVRVSGHLALFVKPGEVVCVHADRTVNWIIAIYAVLEAGGIYCPIDSDLPGDVRDHIFSQSGSRIFIAPYRAFSKAPRPNGSALSVSLEELLERAHSLELVGTIEHRIPSIRPEAGAYVCFTSGSCGSPKGVLCSHQSLVAFQRDFNVRLRSRPGWRVGQIMSPSFDGSIHEIFSALSYGATLVLRSSADPFETLSSVDAAMLVPSVAGLLVPQNYPSLRVLYLVGETVPQALCDTWASEVTTYNMYGPTEATCGATIKELRPYQPPTLGKPNPSTRVYVLDSQKQLVPKGVIGTIYLAGVQVSQGYINKPSETADRFLPDCFGYGVTERMYLTGDRGYWDEQGELCFCGRSDRELKLRGFRVDLDDIEIRIQKAIHGCTGVAVACSDDGTLLAQVQPHDLDVAEVKLILYGVLPSYMVPRHIVSVSEFPRTNAGKLDYKGLKHTAISPPVPPSTSISKTLLHDVAGIWNDILGLSGVKLDVDSSFLELGGHSISQLQLANRLSKLLGRSISPVFIMQSATLGDLVDALHRHLSAPGRSSSPEILKESLISPIELEWCSRYRFGGSSTSSFNVAFGFALEPTAEISNLHKAWNMVLSRHEVLKSNFKWISDVSVQRTLAREPPRVRRMDTIDIEKEINRPFDLERDFLIRILLAPDVLLLVASHIIFDYTSLRLMLQEVDSIYTGVQLAPQSSWTQRPATETRASPAHVTFWKDYLRDVPDPDNSIGSWQPRTSCGGTSYLTRLPREAYAKLRGYVQRKRMTPHQVLLTAVSMALQYHADAVDIVIGVPHLGRRNCWAQERVGLFLEPMPVRIRYPPPPPSPSSSTEVALPPSPTSPTKRAAEGIRDFPKVVQEASQSALGQSIPWHQILDAVGAETKLPDWPLFDVMVSYHEDMGKTHMAGSSARPLFMWTRGSKFKLMVEFSDANDDCLLMRLEYSDECFDTKSILVVARLIAAAFILTVEDRSFEETRATLAQVREGAVAKGNFASSEADELFGMKFEDL
ncbi:nonribosomal peptide synthase GliP-like protein [Apiospora rasikravindrae]|uniref:Nonribosomal peptide synthase GliP-like protein n=1 Tax=Apiospora rasikravindrae TaxID=990691 RepID=A0ABR1TGH8_9PEZI